MRDRMQRFMEGRYGQDQLSRFLSILALIFLVISMFVSRAFFLFYLAVVLIIYSDFRIMSRNTVKRSAENDRFIDFTNRLTSRFGWGSSGGRRSRSSRAQNRGDQREQKKIYKYFKCPKCGQKVRVPRGHGKICITCPKCRVEFVRRS